MSVQFLEVPKWGLSMEEGTVVAWLVGPGERFSEGDDVCEIETSKITNIVEAPFSGTLRKIMAEVGVTLPVGEPIAACAENSVSDAEVEAAVATVSGGGVPASGGALSEPEGRAAEQEADMEAPSTNAEAGARVPSDTAESRVPEALLGATEGEVFATQAASSIAAAHGINLAKVTSSGRGGRIAVADVLAAVEAAGGMISVDSGAVAQVRATPLARRMAAQAGIDLASVEPSGPRGRIQKADVEQVSAASVVAPAAPVPASLYTDVPMSGMRRTIAERLTAAARDIPHFKLSADIRLDALLDLRKTLNENAPLKISVTDMLVKAVSNALMAVPDCNVQVMDGVIRKFERTDICLAVALDGGLLTPKVECVDKLSLSAVAAETASLIAAARAGTLQPDQFSGGTFTISNLGMYGVPQFDAIINPPQGAILAVGAGRTEGHGYKNGDKPATMMTVTLSSDHRAIDGALGAQWLQAFKANIENPIQIVL